jgi:hypothetical protein
MAAWLWRSAVAEIIRKPVAAIVAGEGRSIYGWRPVPAAH